MCTVWPVNVPEPAGRPDNVCFFCERIAPAANATTEGRSKPLFGRASGGMRGEFLVEVAQGKDLDAVLEDLIDHAVRLMKHFTHRGLVPFGNHSPLFGEISK